MEKIDFNARRLVDVSEPLPEEKYYIERLEELKKAYQRDAEPIVNELIRLRSLRTPKYVITPIAQEKTNDL